ncbi:MAG: putative 4-hydroxybenzoate polyprenyltransferase [Planctomycetota bacterium]|nr:putative 4-hydroxybenzoate polyprenyltransferase [Planctomycetota bacterium]
MLSRLALVLDSIKIAHSVFALPFALVAMLVAAGGWPAWGVFGPIVLCMVAGRSAAMAFNRWADRRFDAENPRTKGRPTVSGALSPGFLLGFVLASAALFVAGAWLLNPVCGALALPVLAILLGYSFAKRFTSLCHFWLGLSLGLAPLGAHLAVTGDLSPLPGLGAARGLPFEAFPLLLGLAVLCWVSGFDLIYACQDYAVDAADPRLHSMPKRLGIAGALKLSTALHALAMALLIGTGVYAALGLAYYAALAVVAALLIYEHSIVKPDDLSRVNVAFFTLNGAVSLVLLAAVALERGL